MKIINIYKKLQIILKKEFYRKFNTVETRLKIKKLGNDYLRKYIKSPLDITIKCNKENNSSDIVEKRMFKFDLIPHNDYSVRWLDKNKEVIQKLYRGENWRQLFNSIDINKLRNEIREYIKILDKGE